MKSKWTDEEIEILKSNYKELDKNTLTLLLPNRTWNSIKLMSNKLGIKRRYNDNRKSDLSILLNDIPISYYWLGFLLADGHFSYNNRLKLTLSLKDKEHVIKFASYISLQTDIQYRPLKNNVSVSVMDTEIVSCLKKKFGICHNKTYIPPTNIYNISDDLFLSMLIGFIDGDGCIRKSHKRKDFQISIKVHGSWLDILCYMNSRLSILSGYNSPTPKIDNHGYAKWTISNTIICQYLKNIANKLNLPVLDRKWSEIDLEYISKTMISQYRIEQVRCMVKKGIRNTDISKILGISDSGITMIRKRNKI